MIRAVTRDANLLEERQNAPYMAFFTFTHFAILSIKEVPLASTHFNIIKNIQIGLENHINAAKAITYELFKV